jgi:2-amino-4-hydroxy-6-hydroxymethyldihydropteridine diphosphokinase
LGGNLGNKDEIFSETLILIGKKIGECSRLSPAYVSPPWGFRSRYPFRNQVVRVITTLSPGDVLKGIKEIENHFGRARSARRYLSRKMDIDILFYDDLVTTTETLTIPHPKMADRRFVLTPLADIAPEFVHPVTGKTVSSMLAECPDRSTVSKEKEHQAVKPCDLEN